MNHQPPARTAAIAFTSLLLAAPLHAQQPATRPAAPASTQPAARTDFKFYFHGKAAEGFTSVATTDVYSPETGYGFDFGSQPIARERTGDNPMRDGFVTSEQPLFFSVKVPEGNYRIKISCGDPTMESEMTVRTEAGHLNIADLKLMATDNTMVTLIANVRRPTLPPPPQNAPGWSQVHMFLAGEAESRCWDDRLTIEFNGARPCISAIEISKADDVPTIFMAGDSTVGDPRRGPGGNWPTQICQYFKPDIAISNNAEGGETTKSFITGARFDKVLSMMKPGDFFLVQFGHNDSKAQWPQTYTDPETTLPAYLSVYLAETKRRGGTLVLVTPMERRANGDTVGPWARAMQKFARENNVPLIDQWTVSKQLWNALGDKVNDAFADQTHLNGYGGYLLSKVVAQGIKENIPELAKHMVDDFKPLDLKQVDAPPAYLKQSPGAGGRPARGQ